MEYDCPLCHDPIIVPRPFEWTGDQKCPHCGKPVYVEVDEGEEGPIFTIYHEMPRV